MTFVSICLEIKCDCSPDEAISPCTFPCFSIHSLEYIFVDNVNINIDGVLYLRVVDPYKVCCEEPCITLFNKAVIVHAI